MFNYIALANEIAYSKSLTYGPTGSDEETVRSVLQFRGRGFSILCGRHFAALHVLCARGLIQHVQPSLRPSSSSARKISMTMHHQLRDSQKGELACLTVRWAVCGTPVRLPSAVTRCENFVQSKYLSYSKLQRVRQ
eukprot:6196924-Pleurochrysis_carterae.AAC.1